MFLNSNFSDLFSRITFLFTLEGLYVISIKKIFIKILNKKKIFKSLDLFYDDSKQMNPFQYIQYMKNFFTFPYKNMKLSYIDVMFFFYKKPLIVSTKIY